MAFALSSTVLLVVLPLLHCSILRRDPREDENPPFFQALRLASNVAVRFSEREARVAQLWRDTMPEEPEHEIQRLTQIVMFIIEREEKTFKKRYGKNAAKALEEFVIYTRNKEYIQASTAERRYLKEEAMETLDDAFGRVDNKVMP